MTARTVQFSVLLLFCIYLLFIDNTNSEAVYLPLLGQTSTAIVLLLAFSLGWLTVWVSKTVQIWQLKRRLYKVEKLIGKLSHRSAEYRQKKDHDD